MFIISKDEVSIVVIYMYICIYYNLIICGKFIFKKINNFLMKLKIFVYIIKWVISLIECKFFFKYIFEKKNK